MKPKNGQWPDPPPGDFGERVRDDETGPFVAAMATYATDAGDFGV